jgi:ribosomal protein L17
MQEALAAAPYRAAKKGRRTTRLQAIVDKLVELAMKGDFYAIREVFERIDGKVPEPAAPALGRPGAAFGIRRPAHARRRAER